MDNEQLWRQRFLLVMLVRLSGMAMFLLGLAIAFTDLVRPGGWPLLGNLLAVGGLMDAVVVPSLLKRSWRR